MGTINLAWWNLQNFFDTDDDPISKDFDFTAAKGWTQEVFEAKKANLAEVLNALKPELLAVGEIEKDTLLEELIAQMGNPHLKVVTDESGTSDFRGIDVSIAYDERKLSVVARVAHLIHLRYRTRDVFEVVFEINETWKFLPQQKVGTYFLDRAGRGQKLANRYQVIDQLVVSRGLVTGEGLTLDLDSVDIFRDALVATKSGRPRSFSRKTRKGTSDHLPLTAVLRY